MKHIHVLLDENTYYKLKGYSIKYDVLMKDLLPYLINEGFKNVIKEDDNND